MRFLNRSEVRSWFEGERVAIVGSGPSVLGNVPGFVDGHDVVVRVNNYRTSREAGYRCDVFYSFFGSSIRKTGEELKRDGVKLCMCKCPNAHAIESEWHVRNRQMHGVDWRPLYRRRSDFWFCDTYIPETEDFLRGFNLLGGHIPTTGFAAILDVLSFDPFEVYLTGFDFFRSKIHNVRDRWVEKNTDDPIRHVPEREREWLQQNAEKYPLTFDRTMADVLFGKAA